MDELTKLIADSRAGDLEAFGNLVVRFQDMAYAYACGILGNRHDAEDAVQDAFLESYDRLAMLKHPLAFPNWLRRLVFKHCDRRTRRTSLPTTRLECTEIVSTNLEPSQAAAKREIVDRVMHEIHQLPPNQRDVITMFYQREYAQEDISQFLGVPISTIKSRLQQARRNLKQRFLELAEESLRDHAPSKRFASQVIARLLSRPKPLDMPGHPVRQVWDAVRTALPDYKVVEGNEVEDVEIAKRFGADSFEKAYQINDRQVLRTDTTGTLLQALRGPQPPVRLVTAGRVFRQDRQDARRAKVFHQFDGVCVGYTTELGDLKGIVESILHEALPASQTRWRPARFDIVHEGHTVAVKSDQGWMDVGAAGSLQPSILLEAGFSPKEVAGFAFGMGLERLAMAKFGVADIRKLWRPPYVGDAAEHSDDIQTG